MTIKCFQEKTICLKLVSWVVLAAFLLNTWLPPAYAQGVLSLPTPGTMVALSTPFLPPTVAGITIHPENPLQLDFIITRGDDNLQGDAFKKESQKLINYFLASLTVPDDEMWVNLSPYESDRIIADGLSTTEMGRDMLVQDYMLKQLTASLMYPEEELGSEFWKRIYAKAQAKFGTTAIPTDTFNKVWIVPAEAEVYVNGMNVLISECHLKVMLESDYVALRAQDPKSPSAVGDSRDLGNQGSSELAKDVIRKMILPAIEQEVNEGKTFANLRQMYHTMILAAWYKRNLKESILGKAYMDQNKVSGIDLADKDVKQKIYDQYIEAFQQGVYDYVKEGYDPVKQEIIPRRYFSGGLVGDPDVREQRNRLSDEAILVKASHTTGAATVALQAEPIGAEDQDAEPASRDQAMVADLTNKLVNLTGDTKKYPLEQKMIDLGMGTPKIAERTALLQELSEWNDGQDDRLLENLFRDYNRTELDKALLEAIGELEKQLFHLKIDLLISGLRDIVDLQVSRNMAKGEIGVNGVRSLIRIIDYGTGMSISQYRKINDPSAPGGGTKVIGDTSTMLAMQEDEWIKMKEIREIIGWADQKIPSDPQTFFSTDGNFRVIGLESNDDNPNVFTSRSAQFEVLEVESTKVIIGGKEFLHDEARVRVELPGAIEEFSGVQSIEVFGEHLKLTDGRLIPKGTVILTRFNETATEDGGKRGVMRILITPQGKINVQTTLEPMPSMDTSEVASVTANLQKPFVSKTTLYRDFPLSQRFQLKPSRRWSNDKGYESMRRGYGLADGSLFFVNSEGKSVTITNDAKTVFADGSDNVVDMFDGRNTGDEAMTTHRAAAWVLLGTMAASLGGSTGNVVFAAPEILYEYEPVNIPLTLPSQEQQEEQVYSFETIDDEEINSAIDILESSVSDRTKFSVEQSGNRADPAEEAVQLVHGLAVKVLNTLSDSQIRLIPFEEMIRYNYYYVRVQEALLQDFVLTLMRERKGDVAKYLLQEVVRAMQVEFARGGINLKAYERFFSALLDNEEARGSIDEEYIEEIERVVKKIEDFGDYEQRKLALRSDSELQTINIVKGWGKFAPEHRRLLEGQNLDIIKTDEWIKGERVEIFATDTVTELRVVNHYSDAQLTIIAIAGKLYDELIIKQGLEQQWIDTVKPDLVSWKRYRDSAHPDSDQSEEFMKAEARKLFAEDYQSVFFNRTIADTHRKAFFAQYIFPEEDLGGVTQADVASAVYQLADTISDRSITLNPDFIKAMPDNDQGPVLLDKAEEPKFDLDQLGPDSIVQPAQPGDGSSKAEESVGDEAMLVDQLVALKGNLSEYLPDEWMLETGIQSPEIAERSALLLELAEAYTQGINENTRINRILKRDDVLDPFEYIDEAMERVQEQLSHLQVGVVISALRKTARMQLSGKTAEIETAVDGKTNRLSITDLGDFINVVQEVEHGRREDGSLRWKTNFQILLGYDNYSDEIHDIHQIIGWRDHAVPRDLGSFFSTDGNFIVSGLKREAAAPQVFTSGSARFEVTGVDTGEVDIGGKTIRYDEAAVMVKAGDHEEEHSGVHSIEVFDRDLKLNNGLTIPQGTVILTKFNETGKEPGGKGVVRILISPDGAVNVQAPIERMPEIQTKGLSSIVDAGFRKSYRSRSMFYRDLLLFYRYEPKYKKFLPSYNRLRRGYGLADGSLFFIDNGKAVKLVDNTIGSEVNPDQTASGDEAMSATGALEPKSPGALEKGGIDFNPQMMDLKEQGQFIEFNIDPSIPNTIVIDGIEGVVPVIINITPILDFAPLLGHADAVSEPPEQLSLLN